MTRGSGKEEEKVMGPLFPRLHVNDAVKGGPRAPPRNKMALYEQFTVPSNRSSPAAAHRSGGGCGGGSNLVPSTSASQVYVCDRPLFRPFYAPSNDPVHLSEKITNNSTDEQVNSTRKEAGRSSTQLKSKDFCAAGSTAEFSSQHRDDNNIKNSSGKKLNNDEEFMVPSIFCAGIPQRSTQEHAGVQEKSTSFCTTSPYKNHSMMSKSSAKCPTDKKHLEGINVSNVRSMNSPRIREKEPAQTLEVEKSSSIQASKEKMGNTDAKASSNREKLSSINVSEKPHPGNSGNQARSRNESVMETQNCTTMRNAVSSKPCADVENSNRVSTILEGGLKEYVSNLRSRNSPRIREKESAQTSINVEVEEKSSIHAYKEKLGNTDAKSSSNREKVSSINVSEKPHPGNSGYRVRSRNQSVMETQNRTTMRNAVPSKPCADVENSNRVSQILEGGLKEYVEKRKRSAGHHDVEQNDDLSNSLVESIPGLEISPDDVVGAIGPKHFWKARRAIVNQQRVFAVQVFELHRLIKVQKLIAASPHLLIEGDPCLGNALESCKNKLAEGNLKTQPQLATTNKEDTQPILPELFKEKAEENKPSPSRDDGLGSGHHGQAATNGTFTSNLPAMPIAPDNKQNNWCVHPPQNQWLVPVVSPSEGLVYKPYTGPCPPAGSFLAPFYANCAPLSLPSTARDIMNSAYGVPIPHQPQHMGVPGAPPMPMNYFPPFSLPVMNPVASASAVEQVNHVAVSQPNGHVDQHSQSSCNMSHLRSDALSGEIWKFCASRDSEPPGSSASSPFDKGDGRGPGLLFPTASVGNAHSQPQPSGSRENQARVIRVVPHNAQTASESAARIFRSIQMERQQQDP